MRTEPQPREVLTPRRQEECLPDFVTFVVSCFVSGMNKANFETPAGTRGPIVQNKPNSRPAGRRQHARPGRQVRPRWGKSCETNPISAGAIWRTSAVQETSYDRLDTPGTSAKQSQSVHCGLGTQPHRDASLRPDTLSLWRQRCTKRSQFPGGDRNDRGPARSSVPLLPGQRVRNKMRPTKVVTARNSRRYWPRNAARTPLFRLLSQASNKANFLHPGSRLGNTLAGWHRQTCLTVRFRVGLSVRSPTGKRVCPCHPSEAPGVLPYDGWNGTKPFLPDDAKSKYFVEEEL